MREERLLERISNAVAEHERRDKSDQEIAVASILDHLDKLLNTRRGSAPIALDYGVPDIQSMATRLSTDPMESIGDIQAGIVEAIAKYEPRLKGVRAKVLDKREYEITISIDIEARVTTNEGDLPVEIHLTITPEGRVRLET